MARGKTLIKLLDDLRAEARLSLNPAHNRQVRDTHINLLQRTQEWLWTDFAWPQLRAEWQVPITAGQRYYDPPDGLDVDRIERIEIFADGCWLKLEPGIDGCHYAAWNSDLDERSWPPRRWRLYGDGEIEVWPVSNLDADETTRYGYLKFSGIRALRPLVDDGDRADLDDRLLTLYAAAELITDAKIAKLKLDEAQRRYARLRGQLSVRTDFKMFGVGRPTGRPTHVVAAGSYTPPSTPQVLYPVDPAVPTTDVVLDGGREG